MVAAFEQQGWRISSRTQHSVVATTGTTRFRLGIPVEAVALLDDGIIYLNLMNSGGNNYGRIPFSFGKNSQKLHLLITEIENTVS